MNNTAETAVQTEEAKGTKKTASKSKKNVYQKLSAIQTKLKAPKNLYNSFGKYNYRNAEGILEAVKPLLAEQEVALIMEDRIEVIGEKTITKTVNSGEANETATKIIPERYIKAIARFIDCESGEEISTCAYANECEHTGMSGDQCTGTASSYARKYCLNALFLLDDTKDSDTDEMKHIENAAKEKNAKTAKQNGWNNQNNQQNAPAKAWGQR